MFAYGVECAIEMAFDGADGQAEDGGDFGKLELFDEAKDEDGVLARWEKGDGGPNEGHLLAGDESRLGGAVAVGECVGDVGDINGGVGGALPEAEAIGAGVVAEEVDGKAHEPGGDGTVAAEGSAGGPGTEEGVLGERLGDVAVADGEEQEAEDALLVEGDDGFEVVEHTRDAGSGRVGEAGVGEASGDEGLCWHISVCCAVSMTHNEQTAGLAERLHGWWIIWGRR